MAGPRGSSLDMRPNALIGIAALVLLGTPLGAQRSILRGVVNDDRGNPVVGARIAAVPDGPAAVSDTLGAFVLRNLDRGSSAFTVRRIGYDPTSFSVELASSDTTEVKLILTTAVVALPTVETRATSPVDMVLAHFYDHRATSPGGHFIVRADIEKANPQRLSDVLRSVPGVEMWTDRQGQHVIHMARSNVGVFGDCVPEYWVDGSRAFGFNVDELGVHDVEAMEIYAGPATLPAEYKIVHGTSSCGVIAIWTRVP